MGELYACWWMCFQADSSFYLMITIPQHRMPRSALMKFARPHPKYSLFLRKPPVNNTKTRTKWGSSLLEIARQVQTNGCQIWLCGNQFRFISKGRPNKTTNMWRLQHGAMYISGQECGKKDQPSQNVQCIGSRWIGMNELQYITRLKYKFV